MAWRWFYVWFCYLPPSILIYLFHSHTHYRLRKSAFYYFSTIKTYVYSSLLFYTYHLYILLYIFYYYLLYARAGFDKDMPLNVAVTIAKLALLCMWNAIKPLPPALLFYLNAVRNNFILSPLVPKFSSGRTFWKNICYLHPQHLFGTVILGGSALPLIHLHIFCFALCIFGTFPTCHQTYYIFF